MATRNQIADAFESVVGGIATEMRFYSEPDEAAEGTIACELFFKARERETHGASAMMRERVELELSVNEATPDWRTVVRRMRDYTDYQGSGQHTKSIEAKIEEDTTLGGVVEGVLFRGAGDEIRKQYGDGWRWTAALLFDVYHRPSS